MTSKTSTATEVPDSLASIMTLLGPPPAGWLDPRFGPVRRFWGARLGSPHPRWWVYGAALARAPLGTSWSGTDFSAAGSSIDRVEALTRALGESLERHAAVHSIAEVDQERACLSESPLSSRLPRCSADEICPPMFRGENWDVPVDHVRAVVVSTGADVLVPTPFVHLGYRAPSFDLLASYPISTGTAFAPRRHDARWRGLCEVAERDAIMQFWLTRSGFRRIAVSRPPGPRRLQSRLARLAEVGLRFDLLDITTDFQVPTVLAVITGREYPHVTVGASCHADALSACCKALDEAVSVRYSLSHDKWRRSAPSLSEFSWVRRLEDHMVLYGSWPDSPAFSFIQDAPVVSLIDFASQAWWGAPRDDAAFRTMSQRLLSELGLTVLCAELPCAETAPYGHTVKVLVPEMVPMSQDHHARWLDTPRLRRQLDGADGSINEYPHPFA